MRLRLLLFLISIPVFSCSSYLVAESSESEKSIPDSSSVLIAAHRGGYETDIADGAPENSVANIRNSSSKSYQLYETDIQRTRDGHFVMIHDATIDRETTGSGKASEMDLGELRQLYRRFRDGSVSEERVATLDEFLKEGKGQTVFKADLKPGVSAYFEEIMQVVVAHEAMDGIIFRVPYEEAGLFAIYRASGVPFSKGLLMFKTHSKKQIDDIKARFESSAIQVDVSKSDPTNPKTLELIRYAAGLGMLVETHAEGSPDDWAQLVDAGVGMFHTKTPGEVKEFLRSRKNGN